MSLPTEGLQTFLPLYDVVPEDWQDARPFFVEALKRISFAVNVREVGNFFAYENLTGQQFAPTISQEGNYRDVYRKIINFEALPNATTKSVAHGINYTSAFTLVNLWISATDPVGLTSFSLQYYSIAASDIKLNLTSTNVVVQTASDYSAYTRSFVIIEYLLAT